MNFNVCSQFIGPWGKALHWAPSTASPTYLVGALGATIVTCTDNVEINLACTDNVETNLARGSQPADGSQPEANLANLAALCSTLNDWILLSPYFPTPILMFPHFHFFVTLAIN